MDTNSYAKYSLMCTVLETKNTLLQSILMSTSQMKAGEILFQTCLSYTLHDLYGENKRH